MKSTEEYELGETGLTVGTRHRERDGSGGRRQEDGDGKAAATRLLSPGRSEMQRRSKRGTDTERAADKDTATNIYIETWVRKQGLEADRLRKKEEGRADSGP